jgi:hypothetical protein
VIRWTILTNARLLAATMIGDVGDIASGDVAERIAT